MSTFVFFFKIHMEQVSRYTVTAALIYANGPIHIGHLAGCYLPADIYVRYLRASGKDVIFVSGTDEHGVPITIKAKKEGIQPQQVVDKYYTQIKSSFEEFGISFDIYSRTSKPAHHKVSQDFFLKLHEKGDFVEEVTEQYFDEKAGQFLADRYIMGTCPHCGNENAYGDQCEKCGSTLSPMELIQPRSTLSGEKPVLKKTKNWYLPLDRMQPSIEKFVTSHPEWKVNVAGQCQSWLKQGLQPRAMTRDLEWGVQVPLRDTEGKVLYVWFDAPIGYITFTQELFEQHEAFKGKSWEPYWKASDTKLVHFIGKDNIVFHCIIFPAMLMAEGSYILPDNVPANEFMNLEGDKISTSRNWAVWLHEYLQEFPGKQDMLRYALCANAPETRDNDFTWKDFQARNNNELAASFGNFMNRVFTLIDKNFDSKVPVVSSFTDLDKEVLQKLSNLPARIAASIEQYRFREAQSLMIEVAKLGDKYFADTEPWKVLKTDRDRAATILHVAAQIAATLSIVAEPFIPFTASKLHQALGLQNPVWAWAGKSDLLTPGSLLKNPGILFEKIEDAVIDAQVQKLMDAKKANELASATLEPAKDPVSYEDFVKMDIRVATIQAAEKVAKTKKLLKLTLDTGIDQRTVVSGIAEYYEPEQIIGRQVCLLANLAPREIKGIMSQGMILMAQEKDGSLRFIQPETLVSPGGTIS
ncbi:MAG: methionine--tRNA ligase [Cytophagaceae bacterium]|jgi:methionyl-tRNA synthetase|nr:methionine--tRNA ligase [Cytophagaceae bacterium]